MPRVYTAREWTGMDSLISSIMEDVNVNDFNAAYVNFHIGHPHDDPGNRFMQFLGITSLDFRMPTFAANKVRMLLGPHYQTIIKAWYATVEVPE